MDAVKQQQQQQQQQQKLQLQQHQQHQQQINGLELFCDRKIEENNF